MALCGDWHLMFCLYLRVVTGKLDAVVSAVTSQTPLCADIDTPACKLLDSKKPNFCSDLSLAQNVCPAYCKLCPVQCYNCNATVLDYHLCNTTMSCGNGEVCMRKELKSYQDGHHEYEMTCAHQRMCDGGSDLTIPFGKRNTATRDITITCCADDLCNYPEQPTPTTPTTTNPGCPKDIVFLVDETSKVLQREHTAVLRTISEIAQRLDIGSTENLVALYGYDSHKTLKKFDLQQHSDKIQLLFALKSQSLTASPDHHHHHADTQEAIKYLVDHILKPQAGDRPGYPDAVVFIGDSETSSHVHLDVHKRQDLQQASQDVIFVSVGTQHHSHHGPSGESVIATDNNHILHVADLITSIRVVDFVVALLLQC